MNRLDKYDTLPEDMRNYLSNYGWHFSKNLFEWASKRMRDRNGHKHQVIDKDTVDTHLKNAGITLINNEYYDAAFVMNMAYSDYYGSSLKDMNAIAMYVKDYLDDVDGSKTRAMDEFVGKCIGSGCRIPWYEMI